MMDETCPRINFSRLKEPMILFLFYILCFLCFFLHSVSVLMNKTNRYTVGSEPEDA